MRFFAYFGSLKILINMKYLGYSYYMCAKSKNRMHNSISFLPKCEKRDILVEPNFFVISFCQKHGKNSAMAKKG